MLGGILANESDTSLPLYSRVENSRLTRSALWIADRKLNLTNSILFDTNLFYATSDRFEYAPADRIIEFITAVFTERHAVPPSYSNKRLITSPALLVRYSIVLGPPNNRDNLETTLIFELSLIHI